MKNRTVLMNITKKNYEKTELFWGKFCKKNYEKRSFFEQNSAKNYALENGQEMSEQPINAPWGTGQINVLFSGIKIKWDPPYFFSLSRN